MTIDSTRLLDAYLQVRPDLGEIITACIPGDEPLRELLIAVFTGNATTEDRITEIASALIAWAADQTDDRLLILIFCAAITNMDAEVAPSLAQTLLGMAKSHIKPETEDNLVALYHFADALITREGGAPNHFEIVFASGLMLLDHDAALWHDKLRIFAMYLAYRGRLQEIAAMIPGLDGRGLAALEQLELATPWEMVGLFDAVETGQLNLANQIFLRLSEREDLPEHAEEIIGGYEAQALMMQHVLSHRQDDLPEEIADDDQCKHFAALLSGNLPLIHLAIERIDYDEILTPSGIYGYNAIRLALALRDADLATDLLTRRRDAGYASYLDDFFLARAALMTGESTKAAEFFAKALRAVEFYDAHNRLEFELYLSCEVSPIQMAWLGHRIDFSLPYEPPANAFNRAHHESRDLTTFRGYTAAVHPNADLELCIRRHCESMLPCLILGPDGCGHQALARKLHDESVRHDAPFQTVLCSSIADADLQLFFFGDRGNEDDQLLTGLKGGTLLVQDIDQASPAMQAVVEHLLHTSLQPGDDDIQGPKIICTARCGLVDLTQRLRPALYHRLMLLPIELPALKVLRDDLGTFATSIIQDTCADKRLQVSLAPSLLAALQTYDWPGNIDELTACLQSIYLLNPKQNHYTHENIPAHWRHLLMPKDTAGAHG